MDRHIPKRIMKAWNFNLKFSIILLLRIWDKWKCTSSSNYCFCTTNCNGQSTSDWSPNQYKFWKENCCPSIFISRVFTYSCSVLLVIYMSMLHNLSMLSNVSYIQLVISKHEGKWSFSTVSYLLPLFQINWLSFIKIYTRPRVNLDKIESIKLERREYMYMKQDLQQACIWICHRIVHSE
jgi:hypothetical protein